MGEMVKKCTVKKMRIITSKDGLAARRKMPQKERSKSPSVSRCKFSSECSTQE